MGIKFTFLRSVIFLMISLFTPNASYAVVAVEYQTNQKIVVDSKSVKKEPKKAKKISWRKILKHGLLPLAQVISFLFVLSVGFAGSELIGLLFFNVAILLAAITMRRKKKPMIKISVIITGLTIALNLLIAEYINRIKN